MSCTHPSSGVLDGGNALQGCSHLRTGKAKTVPAVSLLCFGVLLAHLLVVLVMFSVLEKCLLSSLLPPPSLCCLPRACR